jgi:homoserine O-succinyltransferase
MPLNLPDKLPAIELLKEENIFVIDNSRASAQDIRPLKIVILNLMPLKITTETDLVRLLSNTPLQLEISFMKLKSHTSKNTPVEHMKAFYHDFDLMRDEKYDGMIITGAPVEQMPYEDVNYWDEITTIFDWARTHVTSTLYICWAAQAGLYHFYGVPKSFFPYPSVPHPSESYSPSHRYGHYTHERTAPTQRYPPMNSPQPHVLRNGEHQYKWHQHRDQQLQYRTPDF